MTYPDKITQRAIELREEGYTAGAILKALELEFPRVDVPCERTIRRWHKAQGARSTLITREEHITQLLDIVNLLLEDDIGKVIITPTEKDTPESKYILLSDEVNPKEITHSQLVARIEGNIDYVCQRYSTWHMFDCFAAHLAAEYPDSEDFYKFLNTQTSTLINTLRTMAEKKTFKGTCPVCEV